MAGGKGTRLKPLTERIPKVMAPVNGRPFLSHLLAMLKRYGIGDIVLCTGYLAEQVREYFGDGASYKLRIRYSQEEGGDLLGTGGALKQAESLLDEYFLVINGDTYLPLDYRRLESAFLERGKQAMIVVYGNRDETGVPANVALDQEMTVTRHDKKSYGADLKYVDAGVLALQRGALSVLEEGRAVSLEDGLYPALIQKRQLVAYLTANRFHDIGTPEQKREFEDFLRRKTG